MEDFKKELKDNWNNGLAEIKKLKRLVAWIMTYIV